MIFYINKDATQPILIMELISDGRNDYKKFHEKIQNSNITFSMTDIITGVKKIANRDAITLAKDTTDCEGEQYYIGYQFRSKDTNVAGKYIGQFKIEFLDGSGTLLAPIREQLMIEVLDQNIKK